MLTLYSGPLSLFARKTEIALAEKGLAYERVMVDFTQERGYQPKHPIVLAHNPKGQVPVLVDGDLALFDSTLIFEYLEDAYPTPPLLPPLSSPGGAKERARVRMLELLADEIVLVQEVRPLMTRTVPPAADPARRAAESEAALKGEALLERRYGDLRARLDGREFFGGIFSTADIAIFMTLLFAKRLHGPSLAGHPDLAAWYDRVAARPSVAPIPPEIAEIDRKLSYAWTRG